MFFGLFNKVWFEMCMYFCICGCENQCELEEDFFGLVMDEDGCKFVYFKFFGFYYKLCLLLWSKKCVESSDEENLFCMYEMGIEFCFYVSFVKYLLKCNFFCKVFFQWFWDYCSEGDVIWYENKVIGKNLLGIRMQMLFKVVKFFKIYINYCIGVVFIVMFNSIVGIGIKLGLFVLQGCYVEVLNGVVWYYFYYFFIYFFYYYCFQLFLLGNIYIFFKDSQVGFEVKFEVVFKCVLYELVFGLGEICGFFFFKRFCICFLEFVDVVVVVFVKYDFLFFFLEVNGYRSINFFIVVLFVIVFFIQDSWFNMLRFLIIRFFVFLLNN